MLLIIILFVLVSLTSFINSMDLDKIADNDNPINEEKSITLLSKNNDSITIHQNKIKRLTTIKNLLETENGEDFENKSIRISFEKNLSIK